MIINNDVRSKVELLIAWLIICVSATISWFTYKPFYFTALI